ncbi:MAG: TorF family putative porin [Gammaproteobacteria bacterium]
MKSAYYVAITLLGGVSMACAQEEESPHLATGTVAFATDYLFRGISQTDRHPAVQGSMDYSYKPWGAYVGVWGSNVDTITSDGELELDFYGGFRGEFGGTGIGWDVGAIGYIYPGDDLDPEKDYVEAKAGASYTFKDVPLTPSATFTGYGSPDGYLESGAAYYLDGNFGLSLPYELLLAFHVGYANAEDIVIDDENEDVIDWRIGISRTVYGFGLNLSYSDTADGDDYCLGSTNCNGTVVFMVSRSL